MVRWLPILRNMPPGNLVTVEDWRTPPPHVSIGRYYKEKICPLFPSALPQEYLSKVQVRYQLNLPPQVSSSRLACNSTCVPHI